MLDEKLSLQHVYALSEDIWATTWQNQQNECAPSEDSDQPGHLPSLDQSLHCPKPWVLSYPLSARRRLIRLGGCPGGSESSLGAQSLLVLSYCGSYICKSLPLDACYRNVKSSEKVCNESVVSEKTIIRNNKKIHILPKRLKWKGTQNTKDGIKCK